MRFLTLEYIKAHSRIDGDAEDSTLERCATAAERAVLNIMERDYEDIAETFCEIPEDILHAMLLLTDHFYQYRGVVNPTAISSVPYSIDLILKPYIKLR